MPVDHAQENLRSLTERIRLQDYLKQDASNISAHNPRAQEALDKLSAGETIDEAEVKALEALVLLTARPAVPAGALSTAGEYWATLLLNHQIQIDNAVAAVGRITMSNVGLSIMGTGFLVGPNLLMTSRHVAEIFSIGVGEKDLSFRPGWSAEVDFAGGEAEMKTSRHVTGIVMIHPVLDMALLRLAFQKEREVFLKLSARPPDDLVGREVIAIGYTRGTEMADVSPLDAIFRNMGAGKHLFPGLVTKSQIVDSYGHQVWALAHDCGITFFSNSGAPIIDPSTGMVLGLQSAGGRFMANFAVPMSEILRDARVIEATAVSGDEFRSSSRAWQAQWEQADPVLEDPPPPQPGAKSRRQSRNARQNIRDRVIHQIGSIPAGADKFAEFLTDYGYQDVVAAVPRSTPENDYIENLILALDRRGLFDDDLLKGLQQEIGVPLVAGDEPTAQLERAGELPPKPSSTVSNDDFGYGVPLSDGIPEAVKADLIEALQDTPLNSADSVQLIAIGSKWHDWIIGPDGRAGTAVDTIERILKDPRPEGRQALTWFVEKLAQVGLGKLGRAQQFARAYGYLVAGEKRRIVSNLAIPGDFEVADVTYLANGIKASRAVVLVKVPQEGLSPGSFFGGTGWLLTPSLVVVAAHLITGQRNRPSEQAVAEWTKKVVVRFDFDNEQDAPNLQSVQRVELIDARLDLAILRLSQPVTDREPLRINPEPPDTELGMLAMIHHPMLGPKKLSIRGGRVIESDAHQVIYTMATQVGSAGGPIFDMEWRVVATHRAWQTYRASPDAEPIRAKTGTTTSALLGALRDVAGPSGQLWREVAAAQPAMRVIDPTLYTRLAQLTQQDVTAVVPMIIHLEGPSTELVNIPGLILGARGDQIVTATGNRESIDALAKLPGVLSIKASLPGGSSECAQSIPHVGAIQIHRDFEEFGDKALIGMIDNGLDIFHHAFRNHEGKTRVRAFWDQRDARARAGAPGVQAALAMSDAGREMVKAFGLRYGALYLAEDLQSFIDRREPLPISFPQPKAMEHGTAVCSIAAGSRTGDSDEHFCGGVAPAAPLVVVRYDLQGKSVGYSKGHIDALAFIGGLADHFGLPVVINISNGMNTGAHDGTADLELSCELFCEIGRKPGRVIVKSAGNERDKGRHALISVSNGSETELRWRSDLLPAADPAAEVATELIELWFDATDIYKFRLRPPTGDWSAPISPEFKKPLDEFLKNDNRVLGQLRRSYNETGGGLLSLEISAGKQADVECGVWTLEIQGTDVKTDKPIHAWVQESLRKDVRFLDYIQDKCTITVPGTAAHVITVGAVATADVMRPYRESSVGPTRKGDEKPELVAPGVALRAALAASDRGIYPKLRPAPPSGTSLAAPHVTGAIALALSARAKCPEREQLNAKQVQSLLRNSARHFNARWNERTGFGELDVNAFFRAAEKE